MWTAIIALFENIFRKLFSDFLSDQLKRGTCLLVVQIIRLLLFYFQTLWIISYSSVCSRGSKMVVFLLKIRGMILLFTAVHQHFVPVTIFYSEVPENRKIAFYGIISLSKMFMGIWNTVIHLWINIVYCCSSVNNGSMRLFYVYGLPPG